MNLGEMSAKDWVEFSFYFVETFALSFAIIVSKAKTRSSARISSESPRAFE